ncbi:hypothetical protein LUZ60_004257 [Juncus effusus]|nr:hypothetical protein LUZ60_004257 [Juncus effusus]
MGWIWKEGPSGFGSASTAEEVTQGIDASNLTAIVTGGTNGIGRETARVLALRGAKVVIASRSLESGMKVKNSLLTQDPNAKIEVLEMDLNSLQSVKSFAESFDSLSTNLNILINNAGIMGVPFELSKDGIESHFATNYLGHFFLTSLLLGKMKSTTKETGIQGRIVNVASMVHKNSKGFEFNINAVNDESRYNSLGAYCNSKLANVIQANELARRLLVEGSDISVNSLHPGFILTNITRYIGFQAAMTVVGILMKPFIKSVHQGAATSCYLALHPNAKPLTGKYFVDCNEANPSPLAKDENLGKKLWNLSQKILEEKGFIVK